jgi:hypothetical protein
MTPVKIEKEIITMEHDDIIKKIEELSQEFYEMESFQNESYVNTLVASLEQYTLEALIRVFKGKLGHVPKQNKHYEYVEMLFNNQDAYNINRMFSSMRRCFYFQGIKPEDEKYIKWFQNRVKYASVTLIKTLNSMQYVEVKSYA